jgi:hypothetical protein
MFCRGRTEYENVHKDGGRLSRRSSNTFERRPSQRYGPRQSHLTKRQQFRQDLKQQVCNSRKSGNKVGGLQTVASLMPEQQPVCSSVASGHSSPLGSRPSPIGSSNTSTGTHKENIHISPKQHKVLCFSTRSNRCRLRRPRHVSTISFSPMPAPSPMVLTNTQSQTVTFHSHHRIPVLTFRACQRGAGSERQSIVSSPVSLSFGQQSTA